MFDLGQVVAAIGVVAAVLAAIVNGGRIVGFVRGLHWGGKPGVDLDISMVGAPWAKVGDNYGVHIQAFMRLRVRNHTGQEARLAGPYLLWREVRWFGRRRVLRKLRLSDNATDATRELEEVVPPYKDGQWLQPDLYFYCDWVPPMPKPGQRPRYPRNSELVLCARIMVPQRGLAQVARWNRQRWNWVGQYMATWARQDKMTGFI